jgi:hypothetical protein
VILLRKFIVPQFDRGIWGKSAKLINLKHVFLWNGVGYEDVEKGKLIVR